MNPLNSNQPNLNLNSANQFSVAPMLDWTDKHCRYFHRQLTNNAWLYSEMITTGALIYGNDLPRFLGFNESEQPVVLQLGGSQSQEMAKCAKLGEQWGYNEININVGCPSDRVQNNMIGACLMGHPEIVADNLKAMKDAVDIPVTVKSRIGIDEQEDLDILLEFVNQQQQAGVDGLIIHARKAWLQGLSPKENRDVPPLRYDWVHKVKQAFPDLDIAINGGLTTHDAAKLHLDSYEGLPALDGVMLGRSVYEKPFMLNEVDELYYGDATSLKTRDDIVKSMLPYIQNHLDQGGKLIQVTRHMLGLFHGLPGGRMWRRYLSQNAFKPTAGTDTVEEAYKLVNDEIQRMQEQAQQRMQQGLE